LPSLAGQLPKLIEKGKDKIVSVCYLLKCLMNSLVKNISFNNSI